MLQPVSFGDVVICVPEMLNMTECYSNPIVNTYANMFKGTNDEKILAFLFQIVNMMIYTVHC